LIDLLRYRATQQPNERAYVFLSDRGREEAVLTFAELDRRAHALAARLAHGGRKGDRALLLFPAGLDFIIAYFGCLAAGIIAVPMMAPRRAGARDSSVSIAADCSPRFVISSLSLMTTRPDIVERFQAAEIDWLTLDSPTGAAAEQDMQLAMPERDDIVFLQYTSGSTLAPKGVMVSHGNLLANSEMIRLAFGNTRGSTYVSWVPLYHDMGLILNVLQSLYVGSLCVLLAPVTFMQRPLTWLRAVDEYRAEVAGAPNFAFDLCVSRFRAEQMAGIDLSCWKVAFNGAEPVRADTIERFTSTFAAYGFGAKTFWPGYGLAEATLLAAGGRRGGGPVTRTVSRAALQRDRAIPATQDDDAQLLVGCGQKLIGERIAIVHPENRRRLEPNEIGEIWLNGPNVARGYWRNAEATASTFQARIEGEDDECWLRTGDLGFLDQLGELYITGRIKDVIIIRGINHYPQDIEDTVQSSHPALRRHGGAAFSVVDESGREKLAIVQEIERTQRHHLSIEDIHGCIREAVANAHEITVDRIALIRPGALPKTTSGKIQRNLARQLWLDGRLAELQTAVTETQA